MINKKEIIRLLDLLEKFSLSGTSNPVNEDIKKGHNLIITKQEQKDIHKVMCTVFDCLENNPIKNG